MTYQIIWFDFQDGISLGETFDVSEMQQRIFGNVSYHYADKTRIRMCYNTEHYNKEEAMKEFEGHVRRYVWEMNLGGRYNFPQTNNYDWTHPEGN